MTAARQSTRLETPFIRHASTLANVDEPTGHTGELARRFTPVRRPTLLRILLGFSPENRGDGRGTRRRYSRASIACDRGSRALDVGSYRPGPWASCTVREADGDARSRLARASRPFAREPGCAERGCCGFFSIWQRAPRRRSVPGVDTIVPAPVFAPHRGRGRASNSNRSCDSAFRYSRLDRARRFRGPKGRGIFSSTPPNIIRDADQNNSPPSPRRRRRRFQTASTKGGRFTTRR